MRLFLSSFALLALLPALAQAESATCEYRNPGHPGWDFNASCNVTDMGGALRAEVSNGSRFTIETGDIPLVNNQGAEQIDSGVSRCWRTFGEHETICIHPEGSFPEPEAPGALAADAGFGGGKSGYCRLESFGDAAETLLEMGACVKREDCVSSDSGAVTCLAQYDWATGRVTETARAEGWISLDGGEARLAEDGCLEDPGASLRFCFSTKAPGAPQPPG